MPIPTATAAEASVLNAAAYRFAALDALPARKAALLALCRYAALKGTILLSAEGINLFVAGSDAAVQTLLSELRGWPGLEGLEAKLSRTAHQPFNRMLVRIKREIIAFGVAGIDPARHTSTRLAPARLKQWLDEGRELTLLDTRNDYEVKLGSFDNAVSLGIRHFRDFPRAARALPAEWKQRPVVMFCTGGIRCEKAGPLLEREGFGQVFQLEGGILKYFEEVGDAHYHGECFVFDQRVGVNAALEQSGAAQCFQCQEPLLPADQADPRYVPGVSCPACHRTPEQRMAQAIEAREARIRRCAQPLPGSRPMDQFKPLNVPGDCDGGTLRQTLSRVLRLLLQSAVLGLGALLVVNGQATAGVMIAASILTSRALAPIEIAIANWRGFVAARQSSERLRRLLATSQDKPQSLLLPRPEKSLSVEGLWLAAPGQTTPIVRDVSFALAARPGFEDRLVLGVDMNIAMLRLASSVLRRGEARYDRRRTGVAYERRTFPVDLPHAENVDFWACDASALPFESGAFGLTSALNLLDCVRAPRDVLVEIARVLGPGARAILCTPYDWSPVATPIEGWLGGHSQRGPNRGANEPVLRALLTPGAHPASVAGLALDGEIESLPWNVRLHDRSRVEYRVHVAIARRAEPDRPDPAPVSPTGG